MSIVLGKFYTHLFWSLALWEKKSNNFQLLIIAYSSIRKPLDIFVAFGVPYYFFTWKWYYTLQELLNIWTYKHIFCPRPPPSNLFVFIQSATVSKNFLIVFQNPILLAWGKNKLICLFCCGIKDYMLYCWCFVGLLEFHSTSYRRLCILYFNTMVNLYFNPIWINSRTFFPFFVKLTFLFIPHKKVPRCTCTCMLGYDRNTSSIGFGRNFGGSGNPLSVSVSVSTLY